MPTIPIITPKPTFLGQTVAPSGAVSINPTTPCELVQLPVNTALLLALLIGQTITVTVQQAGTGPTGPYPQQIARTEQVTQRHITNVVQKGLIGLEVCTFKTLLKNTNYILRITITDPLGTAIALSTNLTIRVI